MGKSIIIEMATWLWLELISRSASDMLFVAFPFLVVFLVARQINFAYKCKLHICPDKAVVFTLSSN